MSITSSSPRTTADAHFIFDAEPSGLLMRSVERTAPDLNLTAHETGKLTDVTRGVGGLFSPATVTEIAVGLSVGSAAARTMHPADAMAFHRW